MQTSGCTVDRDKSDFGLSSHSITQSGKIAGKNEVTNIAILYFTHNVFFLNKSKSAIHHIIFLNSKK